MASNAGDGLIGRLRDHADWVYRGPDDLYGVAASAIICREAADTLETCRAALIDQRDKCVGCGGTGYSPPPGDMETYPTIHLPCTRCAAVRAALEKLEDPKP